MLTATVVGRVGRDAETRAAGSSQVCNFSIATEHGFGDKKVTTWVDIAIWGKQAEWCGQNIRKGDNVAVTGKGYLRKWDKDGKSGSAFTVEANDCQKIWEKKEGEGSTGGSGGGSRGGAPSSGGGYGGGSAGGSAGGGGAEGGTGGGYQPNDDIPFAGCDRWRDDQRMI